MSWNAARRPRCRRFTSLALDICCRHKHTFVTSLLSRMLPFNTCMSRLFPTSTTFAIALHRTHMAFFQLEPYHRNVPDAELIADLLNVAREMNAPTVTMEQYDERGQFHPSCLARRFGGWFKALEQAGLPKTRNLHISNDDLFRNIAEVWERLGRQPRYTDLSSQSSRFSTGAYEYRFGGWRKALEAFVTWANEFDIEVPASSLGERRTSHRTPRNINYRLRFLVMRRDNFRCCITGRSPATDPTVILVVDHIIAWDKGGETVMDNLQTLANDVNIGKSNLPMDDGDRRSIRRF